MVPEFHANINSKQALSMWCVHTGKVIKYSIVKTARAQTKSLFECAVDGQKCSTVQTNLYASEILKLQFH